MTWQRTSRLWLPRTGQTITAPTAGYRTGDDGWFQAGSPGAVRFVNNANGTVFDRATHLTWARQPQLIIPGAPDVHATNQAQVARGDWATSTAYALADLIADGDGSQSPAATISAISKANPGVATTTAAHGLLAGQRIVIAGCTGGDFTGCNGRWTVTVLSETTFSFGVNTTAYTGAYDVNSGTARQVKFYVCSAAHTSGTLADDIAAGRWRLSVWTASAANLTTPATMDWNAAIDNCLGTKWGGPFSYAGFTDWRLPNARELLSLIDYSRKSPAIDIVAFPATQSAVYWCSTSRMDSTVYTFYVTFADRGWHNDNYAKASAYYVRPVRGGRMNAF